LSFIPDTRKKFKFLLVRFGVLSMFYGKEPQKNQIPLRVSTGFQGRGVWMIKGDEPYDNLSTAAGDAVVEFVYGDSTKESSRPYDLFFLRGSVGGGVDDFTATFFSEGILSGKTLYRNNGHEDLLGIFLNYDFIYNDIVNLGANSFGGGWIQNGANGEPVGSVILSFVGMGSSECAELKLYDLINGDPDEERRDYDLGIGGNLKVYREFQLGSGTTMWIRENNYILKIFEDGVPTGGSSGYTFKNWIEGGISQDISSVMALRLSGNYWFSMTDYDDIDDSSYSFFCLALGVMYRI
jgi:hypothetical protein